MWEAIFRSYRSKLIIALIMVSIIPVSLVSFTVYQSALNAAYKQAGRYYIREMESFLSQLDVQLGNVELSSFSLLLDKRYVDNLSVSKDLSGYSQMEAFYYINQKNEQVLLANPYISSVYTYSEEGRWLAGTNIGYTMDSVDAASWLGSAKSGQAVWRTTASLGVEQYSEIIFCKYFNLTDSNSRHRGIVSVNLLFSTVVDFFDRYNGQTAETVKLLITEGDNILYSRNIGDKELEAAIMHEYSDESAFLDGYSILEHKGVPYMMIGGHLDRADLHFFMVESLEELRAPIRQSLWLAVLGIVFMLVSGLVISVVLGKKIAEPVITLTGAMTRAEHGDFSLLEAKRREDEFDILFDGFNNMLLSIDNLTKQIVIQYEEQKALDLKLLQNQINAHFLYNTLDVIHWIASEYEVTLICDMVKNLSQYYRLSLSSGRDLITLSQASELLESYISIFNIKALDSSWNAEFSADIPKELRQALTLKYIFQPVVENALIHGFPKESGRVALAAKITENGALCVKISNTGNIMPQEQMAKLNAILSKLTGGKPDENFALKNISRQIKNLYGDAYGLAISSEDGLTVVTFYLPLEFDT